MEGFNNKHNMVRKRNVGGEKEALSELKTMLADLSNNSNQAREYPSSSNPARKKDLYAGGGKSSESKSSEQKELYRWCEINNRMCYACVNLCSDSLVKRSDKTRG